MGSNAGLPDSKQAAPPACLGRAAFLLSLAALVIGFLGLRAYDAGLRQLLIHDEWITILLASANLSKYWEILGRLPQGAWIPIEAFEDLRSPADQRAYGQIYRDLVHQDIHPPLYFYALHGWRAAFGDSLTAHYALNALFSATTILAVAWLALRITANRTAALAAAALFALSPLMSAPYQSILRQYELLQLCVILSALGWTALARDPRHRRANAFVAAVAAQTAGLLTHIQFVLVMAAAVGAAFLHPALRWRGAVLITASAAGATILFLLLHPELFAQVSRQQSLISDPAPSGALSRMVFYVTGFAEAFGLRGLITGQVSFFVALAALVAGFAALWILARRAAAQGRLSTGAGFVALLALFTILAYSAQYLGHRAPEHAAGGRYFLLFWGLGAVTIAALVATTSRRSFLAITAVLLALCLADTTLRLIQAPQRHAAETAHLAAIAQSPLVYTDTARRGHSMPILANMSEGAQIYLGAADTLEDFQRLLDGPNLPQLSVTTDLYVDDPDLIARKRALVEDRFGDRLITFGNARILYQRVRPE